MKLLICQNCGVVIRSDGKNCAACGIQLALNAPTQIPSLNQDKAPLTVSVKHDLLVERVVTERQISVLGPRPASDSVPLSDDVNDFFAAETGGKGSRPNLPEHLPADDPGVAQSHRGTESDELPSERQEERAPQPRENSPAPVNGSGIRPAGFGFHTGKGAAISIAIGTVGALPSQTLKAPAEPEVKAPTPVPAKAETEQKDSNFFELADQNDNEVTPAENELPRRHERSEPGGAGVPPASAVSLRPSMSDTITPSKTKLQVSDDESEAEDFFQEKDETGSGNRKKPKSRELRNESSGSAVSPKRSLQKRPKKSEAYDEDDHETDKASGTTGGALGWLETDVRFGVTVSRKTVGIFIAVALLVAIQLPGWLSGQQPPGQQPQVDQSKTLSTTMPIIGGKWRIETMAGNKPFAGEMSLTQTGTNFTGHGQDGAGVFNIENGKFIAPDKIAFQKKYDQESRHRLLAHNEALEFEGKLAPQNSLFTAEGGYQTTRRNGSTLSRLRPARVVHVDGKWTATQLIASAPKVGLPLGLDRIAPPSTTPPDWRNPQKLPPEQPKDWKTIFLMIAAGLVAIGVGIYLFFLMLFSPSGLMNILEKKKYIPSQFRPDHMKMVKQYGRPLKPGGVPLGRREEWHWWCPWTPRYLTLPEDVRKQNPHILMIGGSDKGKTRLMASMITHDIKSDDRAVVVIDSDGQLCDLITEWIASQPDGAKYAKRVVVVDPTYTAGSLAYNPLEMPDDGDLQSASSAIVHGFKAIYTEPPGAQSQWNAQTANILRNSALLLMANGRTLTDLPNLLQDNDFRDIMLEAVERKKSEKTEYITILETWNQYKKLARTDQWITWVEPILNRVGPMLSDGRIRPILTKPVSDLKLKEIIKGKRILIVKVPQGELDQNANLLGSLIVTGLQQAAMALAKAAPRSERPVSLYLDEMDSFIEKETIESITSETKRFQIAFVGCIKTFQHLPEDYRNQLVINMGSMCIFALSKKDGDMLGPQMFRVDGRKIKHQTIQNFFNRVNTSPTFELIMDEEKLNIDRIVGQEVQTYFCYRVGTIAGVFKLKAFDFKDIEEKKINQKLIEKMHAMTDSFASKSKGADKETQ